MKVETIQLRNFGPFAALEEMRLGGLATIVGQNDVGKSYILRALGVFFDKVKLDLPDVHDWAEPEEDVVIELSFTSLPDFVEFEDGVETSLAEEMLLDARGKLRIRKMFPRSNLSRPRVSFLVEDFEDDRFAALVPLAERDLNDRCQQGGLDVMRAGRGITNKSKRASLREKAQSLGVSVRAREVVLDTKSEAWRRISGLLPDFVLFQSETRTGVGETAFQSEFRPVVKAAADQSEVVQAREAFTGAIGQALQSEVNKIFEHFQLHTDAFTRLEARPTFSWEKAVSFDIAGVDQHGIEKPLERRGSGVRRLLMVAFFQYLAERGRGEAASTVFAVEEPENSLHPGLQRKLITSFRHLADEGVQIIITSHSPVFAGASPIEDLALVTRSGGVAQATQDPDLDLEEVARELGVEPADQITGYNAIVFVEGVDDVDFWRTVVRTLAEAGQVEGRFEERRIGLVITGGNNLKHWIDLSAMKRLSRRFAIVVDSDKKRAADPLPQRKLNWKSKCEAQGGVFIVLRKREIENYLHGAAIERSGRTLQPYDEFADMKALFGPNVCSVVKTMTVDEILEGDRYEESGVEGHELLEIAKTLAALTE